MHDVTEQGGPAPHERPDALAERVDAIERLLMQVLERSSEEIRTRRLAVIEDDGFERVVLEANGTHGEITVTARSGHGGSTAAEIYAHDPTEGDGPTTGIALVQDGNLTWVADLLAAGGGAAAPG